MTSTQDSMEISSVELPLPPQFESIEDLNNMPSDRLKKNPLVNVIGMVKDYQPPIATRGSDFKCTITIVDLSTQSEGGKGVQVSIFWPKERMPHISNRCDVVLLRKFKVQMRGGYVSLLANWASDLQIIHASSIPSWPLKSPFISQKKGPLRGIPMSSVETGYSVWLFHHIDRALFTDLKDFQESSRDAVNIKDKYSLLKDIKHGNFYDLMGEVIRVFDKDGRVTLYISDYTAHSLFFNNTWSGVSDDEASVQDGGSYGNRKPKKKAANDWPGPYGKMSIQLTVYDSHAVFIREQAKQGDWLLLRNVQVKMGNLGGCLEGYLREDRGAWASKVQVQVMRRAEDVEQNDVRWKDGLRRKKLWWDKFKKQKQKYMEEIEKPLEKRKVDEMALSKSNGKKRRKAMRAAAEQKVIIREQKVAEKLDLNLNVKAIDPERQPIPLSDILKNIGHIAGSEAEFDLPFMNVKYKSNLRVVNFSPNKLKDFSVGRRVSEYDVLSDFSGDESTDNEECMHQFRAGKGWGGKKVWEWRFALKVVDASKTGKENEYIWLMVDNQAAQMMLNLDAVNLRQDKATLEALQEILFTLWGDLEEKKSLYIKSRATTIETAGPTPTRKPGDELPPDSDDENGSDNSIATQNVTPAPFECDRNVQSEPGIRDVDKKNPRAMDFSAIEIKNKGFTCCIEEYGIKVSEKSASKADAGRGMRWKRMFRIFGTKIT